jgi:hypothetical protein
MKYFGLLFFLYGCSQLSPPRKVQPSEEASLISLESTYDHIRSSYLKGCVDAFKELRLPLAFDHCLEKAKIHEQEVRQIVD